MFVLEDLTVTYPDGTRAVEGVSFRLAPGESAVLAGANGAGKSSLILAAVGVLPSTGMVCADGVTLEKKNLADLRRRVGVLFQNPDDQLFSATIYDDIAFGPRNMGLSAEETERRVSEALALLGIEYLRGKTALKLSGGEKRLAALASVLAMKPSVLLFDEPTAFLDPRARRNLIKIMNGLPQTKLIASHDLPFAGAVASRAIVLKRGRLFADGAAREILRDEKLMEEGGL
ncbi:energy-coupling factor ABC transporter ATP-binding protein [Synergistes jonesii]|uniref:energy-coupling factor ABC transporter ATP-binding protein n=1 Tax=Synergistes jonesii TaxID=2754 RepID=UPI0033201C1B